MSGNGARPADSRATDALELFKGALSIHAGSVALGPARAYPRNGRTCDEDFTSLASCVSCPVTASTSGAPRRRPLFALARPVAHSRRRHDVRAPTRPTSARTRPGCRYRAPSIRPCPRWCGALPDILVTSVWIVVTPVSASGSPSSKDSTRRHREGESHLPARRQCRIAARLRPPLPGNGTPSSAIGRSGGGSDA
jgi:hypothetical protein